MSQVIGSEPSREEIDIFNANFKQAYFVHVDYGPDPRYVEKVGERDGQLNYRSLTWILFLVVKQRLFSPQTSSLVIGDGSFYIRGSSSPEKSCDLPDVQPV